MDKNTYCNVYLFQLGKKVVVNKGCLVIDVLIQNGIHIESPCGGNGTCGKCSVLVLPNKIVKDLKELYKFKKELACKYIINTDITIIIPENPNSNNRKNQIIGDKIHFLDRPIIRKEFLQLGHREETPISDQELVGQVLEKFKIKYPEDLKILRKIPSILRKSNFTIVANSQKVLDIEEGDTTNHNYGVAFDIGTTTIVGSLVDLTKGITLAIESSDNPQRIHGADVISRISYVMSEKNGLFKLHKLIIEAINDIIRKLSIRCKVKKKSIYAVSFLGNTTMMHLLLNINPINIATSPYVCAYKFINYISPNELGVKINPLGKCIICPNIGGFVGGDTVGAVLDTELTESKDIKLLIDIGTNGEIVLGSKEKGFFTCSTAAGPAFEGAQIKFGMRAVAGAIENVEITDDVYIKTIDNAPPIGICGSGIIDCIGELLKVKLINYKGNFLQSYKDILPERISRRIIKINKEYCFILSFKEDNPIGEDIVITQKDIRQVQLAKGAIFTGVKILQHLLNISDQEICEVKLAGAFGSYIKKESACRIGMLPKINLDKIVTVGNAAGSGARKLLLSEIYYEEAVKIAKEVQYVELSKSLDFTNVFLKSLNFPENSN